MGERLIDNRENDRYKRWKEMQLECNNVSDDRFLGLIRFDSNFDNFPVFKALIDTKPQN